MFDTFCSASAKRRCNLSICAFLQSSTGSVFSPVIFLVWFCSCLNRVFRSSVSSVFSSTFSRFTIVNSLFASPLWFWPSINWNCNWYQSQADLLSKGLTLTQQKQTKKRYNSQLVHEYKVNRATNLRKCLQLFRLFSVIYSELGDFRSQFLDLFLLKLIVQLQSYIDMICYK